MKKNKMMRLASGLLVAVLLTTSMISGTFAKYVTTAGANDVARVAGWGVVVTAASDLFDTSYKSTDTTYGTEKNSVAVKTDDTSNLIAPGTTKAQAALFSITGTPEVAVRVDVTLDEDDALKMVTLPSGTYNDPTNDADITGDADKWKLDEDYKPVKWTLKRAKDDNSVKEVVVDGETSLEDVNLDVIEEYLTTMSKEYDPNTDLSTVFGYYELSWTWDYSGNDKADTYLGNLAARLVVLDEAVLTEEFNLSISVTQID